MAIFLPALIVLGGAAAALFVSCTPSKDPDPPDSKDPESDDPSATPLDLTDSPSSTPQTTYSDETETPASSTATGTPWPPSTTPYFTPTPASTPEPTDDEVPTPTITPVPEPDPTPSNFVMKPGEFTMMFHLILPDNPSEAIIPMDSYLDGITRKIDQSLREASDGEYGVGYYPDEDSEFSNRVVVDEIRSSALYDQTLELSTLEAVYDAEMGEGAYDERFGDNAIHIILAPNTYLSGGGQGYMGYPMMLLTYNLKDPQTMIVGMKTADHENGHGYGVRHPHEGNASSDPAYRTSELVNREDGKKNCDQDEDGDGICDTEADPGYYQGCTEISLATCKVQCTEPETGDPMVDANGDEYDPDTSLVMGYYTDDCRYAISEEESDKIETTAAALDSAFAANGGHYAPPSSLRRLAPPAKITVDPFGVPPYTTVNSALRAGRDGVEIYLTPHSTYYENVFFAGIHAFIFGQDSTLNGMGAGPAIEGVSASLSIEGLTIREGSNPEGCGGGISILNDGVNSGEILLSLKNSVVEENTAELGAGICAGHGGRVEILNSLIENNEANSKGGGIYTYNVGEGSIIEGSEIRGNMVVQGYGGGINVNQQYSPITIRSTVIEGNQTNFGGGLEAIDANVVFEDTECVGNTAQYNGGCFELIRAGFAVYDSSIFGNSASYGPEGYARMDDEIASIFVTNTGVLWESEAYKSDGPNFQMMTPDGTKPQSALESGVAYKCSTDGNCIKQDTGETVAKPQVIPAPIEIDNSQFRGDDTVPISALPDRLRRIMESVSAVSR